MNLTSTAALTAYEGGAGYNAAKFAQHAITSALRLEEVANNLRVIEVVPGLVQTEEFALNRLAGDAEAAKKVYEGVAEPLTAADVAMWWVTPWGWRTTSTWTRLWCAPWPRPPTTSSSAANKHRRRPHLVD